MLHAAGSDRTVQKFSVLAKNHKLERERVCVHRLPSNKIYLVGLNRKLQNAYAVFNVFRVHLQIQAQFIRLAAGATK